MKNMKELNLSMYCVTKDGEIYSLYSNRMLKPYQSIPKAGGYMVVNLVDDDGKHKIVKVHRLVALMYLPKIDGKEQVNHIDGNKLNNSLRNLEWVSAKENSQHAHKTGLTKSYKNCEGVLTANKDMFIINDPKEGRRLYNSDDVHNICYHLQQGYRICDVAKILGIHKDIVNSLKLNKIKKYSDIVTQYNFDKLPKFQQTSPDKVIEICKLIQKGLTNYAIADIVKVDRKTVEGIKLRKTYTNITGDYVW